MEVSVFLICAISRPQSSASRIYLPRHPNREYVSPHVGGMYVSLHNSIKNNSNNIIIKNKGGLDVYRNIIIELHLQERSEDLMQRQES